MNKARMLAASAIVLVFAAGAQAQMAPMPGMATPAPPPPAVPQTTPQAMPGMEMPVPPQAALPAQVGAQGAPVADTPGMKMGGGGMAGMDMAHMPAALGPYLMNRESSGRAGSPTPPPTRRSTS